MLKRIIKYKSYLLSVLLTVLVSVIIILGIPDPKLRQFLLPILTLLINSVVYFLKDIVAANENRNTVRTREEYRNLYNRIKNNPDIDPTILTNAKILFDKTYEDEVGDHKKRIERQSKIKNLRDRLNND